MKPKFNNLPVESVRRITSSASGLRRDRHKKITWHTSELYVRTFLPYSEYQQLISNIVNGCITKSGDIVFDAVDFSIRLNIVMSYALVDLPEDIEELYYIVYESDLYDTVCSFINKGQIESVRMAVMARLGLIGW